MSASWKTGPVNNGPEKYRLDSAEYHDTAYINLNDRDEWAPDFLVEDAQGCDGEALPVLIELDPPHGDWQKSHIYKREYTSTLSRKYSPALNVTKAGESKSSCEFNQGFVGAIATMRNSRAKLHHRNPQMPYPSTPHLSR
jgi:hypothetical protein